MSSTAASNATFETLPFMVPRVKIAPRFILSNPDVPSKSIMIWRIPNHGTIWTSFIVKLDTKLNFTGISLSYKLHSSIGISFLLPSVITIQKQNKNTKLRNAQESIELDSLTPPTKDTMYKSNFFIKNFFYKNFNKESNERKKLGQPRTWKWMIKAEKPHLKLSGILTQR